MMRLQMHDAAGGLVASVPVSSPEMAEEMSGLYLSDSGGRAVSARLIEPGGGVLQRYSAPATPLHVRGDRVAFTERAGDSLAVYIGRIEALEPEPRRGGDAYRVRVELVMIDGVRSKAPRQLVLHVPIATRPPHLVGLGDDGSAGSSARCAL